jgi:hypothetical protein
MPAEYTSFDVALTDSVNLSMPAQGISKIAFQFPPKITSDGRKGEWNEDNMPGTEPLAVYKLSGPREISLHITYIVDGGKWTTDFIKTQVSNLRGYFARYRVPSAGGRGLVVYFKMWKFGGEKAMSCRIKNIDVKHSETIVAPNGDPSKAYALRTDLTVELRIWSMGGPQQTQKLPGLITSEPPDWY